MSRWWRIVVCLAIVAAYPLRASWADSLPQMHVQVDQDTVGVGDFVHLELQVQSSEGAPRDPQLGSTPGFVVRGQNASPSQTHISINGSRSDRYGLDVEWALQAKRVGTFTVGPFNIAINGVHYSSNGISLRVVPAGQAPRRAPAPQQPPSPFGFSPFDPWKGLIQGLDSDQGQPPPSNITDPKLSLDAPRGDYYFLHATVDKTSAVIGEPILFSVYEYIDQGRTNVEVDGEDVRDPVAADFVNHPLLPDDQQVPLAGFASIGDSTWKVQLVRRWMLFPLRAGDLTIGPMSVTMMRPRMVAGQKRTTESFQIHVTEPPRAGRPPGYAIGDVGHFALTAEVNPRQVEAGGAIGVHVELSGTGNIPSAITAPIREGVEWLAPEVHEQLGPTGHDAYGGKRTFDFVVRVHRGGDVDLGEIALPFWDPQQKRYDVARAKLGVVHVTGSATSPEASSDVAQEALPGLPGPRDVLEGTRAPQARADDSPVFWLAGVGAWPLAFGVAVAGRSVGRRAIGSWRSRRASPAAGLRERMSAAQSACAHGDPRAADAATTRALDAAVAAHLGTTVRGAVGGEVVERLERAGAPHDVAVRIADLLKECEAARFAPEGSDVTAARGRWARARSAIRELERGG